MIKELLTAKFFLPLHFSKQAVGAAEKVGHFAVLIVAFGTDVHTMFCFVRQILTDLRDWKHNLLQRPVTSHDLDLSRVRGIVVEGGVDLKLVMAVHLGWTKLLS